MKEETKSVQECKETAAEELGYKDWNDFKHCSSIATIENKLEEVYERYNEQFKPIELSEEEQEIIDGIEFPINNILFTVLLSSDIKTHHHIKKICIKLLNATFSK